VEEAAERLGIGVSAFRHRFRKGAELYREKLREVFTSRSGPVATNKADTFFGPDSAPKG